MIIHDVVQGSPEWHALRAGKHTASEASAMMGASTHTSRGELLRMKATGSEKEFSAWVQKNILDKGHAIEDSARPIIEEEIGEELYPCVGTSDERPKMLASFDGLTMLGNIIWECKSWNKGKVADVKAGKIPDEDFWQVVHQMVVSRAEVCIYTVTDGTPENLENVEYLLTEEDEARLLAGWDQFNIDLANYQHAPAVEKAVAAPIVGLPAITYRMSGLALTSNLAEFRAAALQAVEDSKKPLTTDQEFADREALCKSFSEAEAKIKHMQEQVLGEVKSIDEFTRELGEIGQLIRQARLAGENQVKDRKEEIRLEIRTKGEREFAKHIAELNQKLGGKVVMPHIADNFAGAMKGKRTLQTLQDAADSELARLKIAANTICARMEINLFLLRQKTEGYEFLFRDAQELVQKDGETLTLIIDSRISEHKAEEERKLEAERERIRQEEQAKAEQKARAANPQPALTLEDAAPVEQTPQPDKQGRVIVTNMVELLRAIVEGQVPHEVVQVDTQMLSDLCEKAGGPLPGTSWASE